MRLNLMGTTALTKIGRFPSAGLRLARGRPAFLSPLFVSPPSLLPLLQVTVYPKERRKVGINMPISSVLHAYVLGILYVVAKDSGYLEGDNADAATAGFVSQRYDAAFPDSSGSLPQDVA